MMRHIKLRSVIGLIGLSSLLLPVLAILLLRIYQNELIRQTESELISQAVILSEIIADAGLHGLHSLSSAGMCNPLLPENPALEQKFALLHKSTNEIDLHDVDVDAIFPTLDLRAAEILPDQPEMEVRPIGRTDVDIEIGAKIQDLLEGVSSRVLSGIRFVNTRGIVVAASNLAAVGSYLGDREEFLGTKSGITISLLRNRQSKHPKPSLDSISRGADFRVFVAKPLLFQGQFCGALIISRTPSTLQEALYPRRKQIAWSACIVILLVGWSVYWVTSVLTVPIQELVRASKKIASGERTESSKPEAFRISEFNELDIALKSMAKSLQDKTDAIQSFSRHVSHEFKTPLSSILGAIELIQTYLGSMSPLELRKFLNVVESDARKLQELLKSLHEYSLAEHSCANEEKVRFKLATFFESFAAKFSGSHPTIEFIYPKELEVQGRPEILSVIMTQLVQNAQRYGGTEVTVRATIDPEIDSLKKVLSIEICDFGPGIHPGNMSQIFNLFFTTTPDSGGTGMGLPIALKMAELQGGTINCRSHPGETVFTIKLPWLT